MWCAGCVVGSGTEAGKNMVVSTRNEWIGVLRRGETLWSVPGINGLGY